MVNTYHIELTNHGRLWIQIRKDREDIISRLKTDIEVQNTTICFWANSDGFSLEGSLSWYFNKDSDLAKKTLLSLKNDYGCKLSKEVNTYYDI